MRSEEMYAVARTILDGCNHEAALRPHELMDRKTGRAWHLCRDCYRCYIQVWKAARKQQLAEHRAKSPRCQRCGKRPGLWIVGYEHYRLCGYCKHKTVEEHYAALAGAGALAIFATGLCIDTRAWANPAQRMT